MSSTNGFTKTALDGAWQPKLIEGFWGVRLRALASCGGKLLQEREVRALVFSAVDVPPWFRTVTYWQVSGVLNRFTNRSKELAGFISRFAPRWSVDWTFLFMMRISYIALLGMTM